MSKISPFDYYSQLRSYQLHLQKIANPQSKVPSHAAFKPAKPSQNRKQFDKQNKIFSIERENQNILSKLVKISKRKPQISKSLPTLSLPSVHRQKSIPLYEGENSKIARRIIQAKSTINTRNKIDSYSSVNTFRSNISRYVAQEGVVINRSRYLAELMLLKKMRVGEILKNSK